MIGGGFLLGTLPATIIYTALLPITGWIVGQITTSSSLEKWVDAFLYKHNKTARLVELLKNEPFTLSAVLRLTPVIPAAIAAIVAATLKVGDTTFVLATLCVGWVRPLFFASIGGAVLSLSQIQAGLHNTSAERYSQLTDSLLVTVETRIWLELAIINV